MAVLVEAISVIVRRDSIESKYRGGWVGFVNDSPNSTLCADDEIARVGFMDPSDVRSFVFNLEREGLTFLSDGKAVDLAVADQQRGLSTECEWLEFGRLRFGEKGEISACWFFDGPRHGAGLHMEGRTMQLATPEGWRFEDSLSRSFGFEPTERSGGHMKFIRSEDGFDVYLDLASGDEVFVARTP